MTKIPSGFLTFACLAQEHYDFWDWRMGDRPLGQLADPSRVAPDIVLGDEARQALTVYYDLASASKQDRCRWLIEEQLSKFLSREKIAEPEAQAFIAQCVTTLRSHTREQADLGSRLRFRNGTPYPVYKTIAKCDSSDGVENLKCYQQERGRRILQNRHTRHDRSEYDDGDGGQICWHPLRPTKVDVIVGSYLSLPDGQRLWAKAADLVNRKAGVDERRNDGHVRNALNSYARKHFTKHRDAMTLTWAGTLLRWRVLDYVWGKTTQYHQLPDRTIGKREFDLRFFAELCRKGLLDRWRADAEREIDYSPPTSSAEADIIHATINEIRNLQKKRQAIGL